MANIKEDINFLLISNAQSFDNETLWIGAGEETPSLELSKELSPSLLDSLGKIMKKTIFYSLYLLFTAPVE